MLPPQPQTWIIKCPNGHALRKSDNESVMLPARPGVAINIHIEKVRPINVVVWYANCVESTRNTAHLLTCRVGSNNLKSLLCGASVFDHPHSCTSRVKARPNLSVHCFSNDDFRHARNRARAWGWTRAWRSFGTSVTTSIIFDITIAYFLQRAIAAIRVTFCANG